MGNDINLKLRSEILNFALILEIDVNSLLLGLLSIEKPQRKAIVNKSGNLSFKNKIDLLFDLDILNSEEYKKLLLSMEFRNQFLHNIDCSSFEVAVKLLGTDKERKLLKFDNADENQDMEFRYKCAFRNLFRECINIIFEKFEDRENQIEDRFKTLAKPIESNIFFIEKYFDILNKIMVFCEKNLSETPEIFQLLKQIYKIVTDDFELTFSSEKFTQIQNELNELHTPERIKALFKK